MMNILRARARMLGHAGALALAFTMLVIVALSPAALSGEAPFLPLLAGIFPALLGFAACHGAALSYRLARRLGSRAPEWLAESMY